MTLLDAVDPFATADTLKPEYDPERITAGRYRLPDLTIVDGCDGMPSSRRLVTGEGPRRGGWQRVTNRVKAIAEARALDLWHQREMIRGFVLRPDLYDLACAVMSTVTDPAELREELESLAAQVLSAAGCDTGRNTGSAFHGFTEAQDSGMIHYARKVWHGKLRNYDTGLKAQGLEVRPEYIERKVVILRYGLAGTLDRIFWDCVAQCFRIGDLKSQKTFWTWTEIAAQLAAYAMADAMWDRARRCYVEMPPVCQEKAVVAWMPIAHPRALETGIREDVDGVDFFDVCLERGRKRLELCGDVDAVRSEDRSKGQMTGLLRPLPGLALVEAYARRLDCVESAQEGSALWAEIATQGLSESAELLEVAREVASRFSPQ